VKHVERLAGKWGYVVPFFGVKDEDMEAIAEKSVKNGSNASNPRPMGKNEYMGLLRSMK